MIWKNRIIKHGEEAPGSLKANPLNFRTHPAGQRFALTGSLNELGWIQDVIVNQRTGLIIDGHLRVDLALEKGEETIPVKYVDLSDDEERIALAAFDAISAKAEIDDEVLAKLLKGLKVEDNHLSEFMDELKKEYDNEPEEYAEAPEAQIDKAEELNKKWQVQGGDVWEIKSIESTGVHKLLCGDNGDYDLVLRLFLSMYADIVVTSPPYSDQRDYKDVIKEWTAMMNLCFANAVSFIKEDGSLLINLGLDHKNRRVNRYWDEWLDEAEKTGWPLFGWYIWDKGYGMPGGWNGRLAPSHEFIFHFCNGKIDARKNVKTKTKAKGNTSKRFRQQDGSFKEATSPNKIGQDYKIPDSVIRANRASTGGKVEAAHPAVYSTDFVNVLINTWSEKEQIVYDPFLGSGTTMVAAEQAGRTCYGMEISPDYCAVILQRMSEMGLEPKRL